MLRRLLYSDVVSINFRTDKICRDFNIWPSLCVDIGAPSSFIALCKLISICFLTTRNIKLRPSTKSFPFFDACYKSLGTIDLKLAAPAGMWNIYVKLDVVAADIPTFLRLDILNSHSLIAETVSNLQLKKTEFKTKNGSVSFIEEWSVPLTKADFHVYVNLAQSERICFTRKQLQKLYRQFVYQCADKLYNLLRCDRPSKKSQSSLYILQDFRLRFEAC